MRNVIVGATVAVTAGSALLGAQSTGHHYDLQTASGLRLHNVTAAPATLEGKKGIRVTVSAEVGQQAGVEQLAVIEGLEFGDGVIEAEIAGAPAAGAIEGARGFVGIAFRLQPDMRTYDAFDLRPTNGRADDQLRRNHSTQYISHPDWPWFRLREETPGQYESYVDLVPGVWTKVKIEVRGSGARLYVHDQAQPTLLVNDLKTGSSTSGGVALWLGLGTVAHFRDLTVWNEPAREVGD
jgi:hypothetical protein